MSTPVRTRLENGQRLFSAADLPELEQLQFDKNFEIIREDGPPIVLNKRGKGRPLWRIRVKFPQPQASPNIKLFDGLER